MGSIALLDRDLTMQSSVGAALRAAGHSVTLVATKPAALTLLGVQRPDMLLVDPGTTDADRIRALVVGADAVGALVFVVSAHGSEEARVRAFEMGVDDYLVKPFSLREVVLRVRSLLRRRQHQPAHGQLPLIVVGPLRIDRSALRAWVHEEPLTLSKREIDVLLFLADRAGRVVTRETLLIRVWHLDAAASLRVVDTAMRRLRGKLGSASGLLHTVRGVGYQLR